MICDFLVVLISVRLKIQVLQVLNVFKNLSELTYVFLLLREIDVIMRIVVTRKRLQTEGTLPST